MDNLYKNSLDNFEAVLWKPEDRTDCKWSLCFGELQYSDGCDTYGIERAIEVAKDGKCILFNCKENGERFQAIFSLDLGVEDIDD
jgi:hypothetical protein